MNISTRLLMTLLAGFLLLHPLLVAWQATRIPDIENDFASHRAGERLMLLP